MAIFEASFDATVGVDHLVGDSSRWAIMGVMWRFRPRSALSTWLLVPEHVVAQTAAAQRKPAISGLAFGWRLGEYR